MRFGAALQATRTAAGLRQLLETPVWWRSWHAVEELHVAPEPPVRRHDVFAIMAWLQLRCPGLRRLCLTEVPLHVQACQPLRGMDALSKLSLTNCVLGAGALPEIAQHTDLDAFALTQTPSAQVWGAQQVAELELALRKMADLQMLELELSFIDTRTWRAICRLSHLTGLDVTMRHLPFALRDTPPAAVRALTLVGLRAHTPLPWLAQLGQVEMLMLQGAGVDADLLATCAAQLPQLRCLWVPNSPIGNDGVAALAPLTRLRELDCSQAHYSSYMGMGVDGARALARLSQLEVLWADGNYFGNEGVLALLTLPQLVRLQVDARGLSGAVRREVLRCDVYALGYDPHAENFDAEVAADQAFCEAEGLLTPGGAETLPVRLWRPAEVSP